MNYPAYTDMKAKVEADLDLQDETIITPTEMKAYFNDAIREAEAEIHGIYEDYFLSNQVLPLVQAQALYSLPANIYASKIRGVTYRNGPLIYPIRRIRDMKKFMQLEVMDTYAQSTLYYKYILLNTSAAAGVQLQLVPPSHETSSSNVVIWYIREANRIVADADVCDIPEFVSFIYAAVKVRCHKKEFNGFCPPEAIQELEQQRKLMVDTLTAMVPDVDTELEKDMSFYYDMYDQYDAP